MNNTIHHNNPNPDLIADPITFAKKMVICIFTGFASGLPLYLLLQLLPAWLENEGVNIKTIAVFTLLQIPYTLKFIIAFAIDNTSPFKLGRRRGWMLLSQICLIFAISYLGFLSPNLNLVLIATLCLIIALFSAIQDIALDAFRREILTDKELGLGNSIHINAYRISSLVPGALALILSNYFSWQIVFITTALFMLPGIIMTLLVKEPKYTLPKSYALFDIIVKPFKDFFSRNGVGTALLILLFIFLYKLGDSMSTSLATPFYLKMGFSLLDIGLVAKNASLWPSIIGALVGGGLMLKIGINKALWIFGVVQAVSILGFVWLSIEGPFNSGIESNHLILLTIVIAFEALGVGLGTAAFVSFIAKTTNPLYTATQLALFTSLASVPRTLINASTGVLVEFMGWTNFFWLCFILAIPGMLLLLAVAPWNAEKNQ